MPRIANLMLVSGIPESAVELVCNGNVLAAYGQSGQFSGSDWLDQDSVDFSKLFEGNGILRGGGPEGDGNHPNAPSPKVICPWILRSASFGNSGISNRQFAGR